MLPLPPLYPITDASRPEPLSAQVKRFGDAGFPLVQFRGKPLDPRAQWDELRACLRAAAAGGGWPLLVVNDRADLALLAAREGLAPWGLHLGQADLAPSEARRLPGLEDLHLGTSTHHEAEWSAPDPACDHAGAGPFRTTATKPDHAPPIGLEGLARACAALRERGLAPVAIGGLTPADGPACFGAGAECLAMTGALHNTAALGDSLWAAQAARWRARPPLRRGQGVVLAGSSGAGKSTLAAALAERLGLPCEDLDARVAAGAGRSIAELFAERGEAGFRALEAEQLPPCLERPAVLALGGGAWETEAVRRAVARSGFAVLWVAEAPEVCWSRAGGDPARPLALSREAFLQRHRVRMQRWSGLPCLLPLGRDAPELAAALAPALD